MVAEKLIKKARARLMELHYQAKAAHLGGSLSCIDTLVVLYSRILGSDDMFVLSKGHSTSALYVALWATGRIGDDALNSFCGDGTKYGGHTPANFMSDIPFGTGSLGHGLSLASGLALGKKMMKKGGRVFCLCSDGELQEGSTWEAVIFSAHHKLDNLFILVDGNGWQGFGSTAEVASLDLDGLGNRLRAFGLSVDCADGHDAFGLEEKMQTVKDRGIPHALLVKTCKGKGAPCFEGQFVSHYAKLTEEQFDEAIGSLGCCE